MSSDKSENEIDYLSSTFGNARVTASERRALITSLFDKIAPRYDLMNDLMSVGLHRLWKRRVIGEAVAYAAAVDGNIVDL
ncbi:MAG: class I SAM-dependent methyltransferase, partial [Beijerinckiaceae bacterium]